METQVPPPLSLSLVIEQVADWVIACGRWIDFGYFDRKGFSIGQWIWSVGCEGFCYIRERYYPHFISEFYGSLARGDGGWIAIIRGTSSQSVMNY